MWYLTKVFSRPGRSQGLLYKHLHHWLIRSESHSFPLTALRGVLCHSDEELSKYVRASKSHQWSNSYGHFTEGVDFAYLLSCIGKGLLLQHAQQAFLLLKKVFWWRRKTFLFRICEKRKLIFLVIINDFVIFLLLVKTKKNIFGIIKEKKKNVSMIIFF